MIDVLLLWPVALLLLVNECLGVRDSLFLVVLHRCLLSLFAICFDSDSFDIFGGGL